MTRLANLAAVADLYATRGTEAYGEAVTQVDHAMQCAALATAGGAAATLVAAALLHDIGHLLSDAGADGHAGLGAAALGMLFGPAVCAPVALHVAAKRYLCCVEPEYHARLSRASQDSLVGQGGAFNPAAATAFERLPYASEAVALRRFDDDGKRDHDSGGGFADYLPLLANLLVARAPAGRRSRHDVSTWCLADDSMTYAIAYSGPVTPA